jgi:hypothetical protein
MDISICRGLCALSIETTRLRLTWTSPCSDTSTSLVCARDAWVGSSGTLLSIPHTLQSCVPSVCRSVYTPCPSDTDEDFLHPTSSVRYVLVDAPAFGIDHARGQRYAGADRHLPSADPQVLGCAYRLRVMLIFPDNHQWHRHLNSRSLQATSSAQ